MTLKRLNWSEDSALSRLLQQQKNGCSDRYLSFQTHHLVGISDVLDGTTEKTLNLYEQSYQMILRIKQNSYMVHLQDSEPVGDRILNTTSIQQSLILWGRKNDFWATQPNLLYISMLQLCDMDAGKDIADVKKRILKHIPESLRDKCALYDCLDFCDFVLFTKDVAPSAVQDLLWAITYFETEPPGPAAKEKGRILRDTYTGFCFNMEFIQAYAASEEDCCTASIAKALEEPVSLTVNVSIRCLDLFEKLMGQIKVEFPAAYTRRVFGRYDEQIRIESITLSKLLWVLRQVDLNCLGEHFQPDAGHPEILIPNATKQNSQTALNSYEITLAFPREDEKRYQSDGEGWPDSDFIKKSRKKVNDLYKTYLKCMDSDQKEDIFGFTASLKTSLLELIGNGFSEEFSISVLHSVIMYLQIIAELRKQEKKTAADPEKNRKAVKRRNRLQRDYLSCLSILSHCTMHGEKRFVQAPALNMNLFDIPPKLLAFYSAIASRISDDLNDSLHANGIPEEYSFLIAPDFRKDIYIMQIEKIDESEEDDEGVWDKVRRKMLVMYLNERQFYNPARTMQLMCHEIAHHVGGEMRQRKERVKYIFGSIGAYLLHYALPKCIDDDVRKKLAEDFAGVFNHIYDLHLNDSNPRQHDGDTGFYLKAINKFIEITNYLSNPLQHKWVITCLRKAWAETLARQEDIEELIILREKSLYTNYVSSMYEKEKNTKKAVAELISNAILSSTNHMVAGWQRNLQDSWDWKKYTEFCENILEIFREAYADMRMLNLLGITEQQEYKRFMDFNLDPENVSSNYFQWLRYHAVSYAVFDEGKVKMEETNDGPRLRAILPFLVEYLKACTPVCENSWLSHTLCTFNGSDPEKQIQSIHTELISYRDKLNKYCAELDLDALPTETA